MPYLPYLFPVVLLLIVALVFFSKWVHVLREYERGVTFWLGKLTERPKGPGLVFVFWPFEMMKKVSLRPVELDVPPQDVITRDKVPVTVNAVVSFRVTDPAKAILEVEDYRFATGQLAQTALRSVLSQADSDELLGARDQLNERLREIVDAQTDSWGIRVLAVAVKHVANARRAQVST